MGHFDPASDDDYFMAHYDLIKRLVDEGKMEQSRYDPDAPRQIGQLGKVMAVEKALSGLVLDLNLHQGHKQFERDNHDKMLKSTY